MDYLNVLRKQVTGLQSGDGPKHFTNSFATPPRMQTPSNNSKIPRFVNHGFNLSKQHDLPPSKMPVPTKRRFDDVPRLDIPLSPDTGDEATANTESTTTSTVLSPSQSGDGSSLVTVDSWKSGNWTSGGNCLCRKSKSAPFSPKEFKEGAGNSSKIIVVDMTQTERDEELPKDTVDNAMKESNDKTMEVDLDVDELTVRLDFKANKKNSLIFLKCEMDKENFKNELVDENDMEEINVSLKPISLKGTESEINEECFSPKGTESFTYDSELSNQTHSPRSGEKVSWPSFKGNGSNSSIDMNKLSIKYQSSDLHARIKSMIDFGKSLLSSRISEQDRERSSSMTVASTFSSRGKSESESHLSTIKLIKKMELADNKNSRRCTPKRKLENLQKLQDKIISKMSSPQLCLLNSAKFTSPTSSEVWYDTNEELPDNKGLVNKEEVVEVDPKPTTSDTVVTVTDSDSSIMLSTVGVQVDLIEWDRMGRALSEVRDIGIQVNKKRKKESSNHGKESFPAIKRPSKKRTVYFDLSTPKQTGLKLDSPNIFYDIKECESDRDSEQDQLSDFQTLSTVTSQDVIKSPYTLSSDISTKVSIIVKEDGSIISKRFSISDDAESCNNDVAKSSERDGLSKTPSEDTYTIDLAKQWSTSTVVKATQAIPVAITSLTNDSKAKWLKDFKSRVVSNTSVPLPTPTKIPSSTKLARESVKKASTSLTQVGSKPCGTKKFQSPHHGERIKSMDEVRKGIDTKGIQRCRGISDVQTKKI